MLYLNCFPRMVSVKNASPLITKFSSETLLSVSQDTYVTRTFFAVLRSANVLIRSIASCLLDASSFNTNEMLESCCGVRMTAYRYNPLFFLTSNASTSLNEERTSARSVFRFAFEITHRSISTILHHSPFLRNPRPLG